MEETYYQFRDFSVPRPLDQHLLAIQLRTTSNSVSDGFNVLISADAGTSRINLDIEDTRLSIECSISQFQVDLTFPNCDVEYGKDYETYRASNSLTSSESVVAEENLGIGFDIAAKLDPRAPSLAVSGHTGRGAKSTTKITVDENKGYLRQLGINAVSFQHPMGRALNISFPEYEGWFARPKEVGKPMAVTATAGIRKGWIAFEDTTVTRLGKLGKRIERFFRGTSPQEVRDQELFNKLLAHLVRLKLQDPSKTNMATLAGDAMVFVPETHRMAMVIGPEPYDALEIHPRLIRSFLDATTAGRAKIIENLDSAEVDLRTSSKKGGRGRSEYVAPAGTATNAVNALHELLKDDTDCIYETQELYERFGENTTSDLRGLGFLTSAGRGRAKVFFRRFTGEPDAALLAAMLVRRSFQVALDVLKEDQRLNGRQVGEAVSDALEKDWKSTSAQRNGQNIKKWIFKLYPNFEPVREGDQDYHYVTSLQSDGPTKGRNPYITPEIRARIVELHLGGLPYNKASQEVGISNSQVVYNNKRKYPELWEAELEKQSSKKRS